MQSDSRLVKLFRRGVEPAFDELVRRYRGALVAYAGAIAGRDRAEDVVQDSLVKAHRSLTGDQMIEPRPWLYTVVRNTALNDIRDNRKHSHDDLEGTADRTYAQPHEVAERREELAKVVAAVSALPASQRRALIGHELGGFSYDEIAAELDVSAGATRQLIYRARLTLRNSFGALIPFPLIAWLTADATGVFATGAAGGVATGAAASGALGSASGTAGVGSGGGLLAGLTGAGTAKLAVVAVVAGGSIAGGIVAERHHGPPPGKTNPEVVTQAAAQPGSPPAGPGTPASLGAGLDDPASDSGSSKRPDGISRAGDSSGNDRGSSRRNENSGSGHHAGTGDDRPLRPARREDHSGPGPEGEDRRPRPGGGHPDDSGPGPGSGGEAPDLSESGDGGPRPSRPAGGGGGPGPGSSGSGASGPGSSGPGSGSGEFEPETEIPSGSGDSGPGDD